MISKLVLKNTMIMYLRMAVTVFISIYTTRLVIEYLGVVSYGIFSIVAGSIALLSILSSSISATSKRFISICLGAKDYKGLNKVFNNCLIIHLLIATIITVVLELAGLFLFNGFLDIPSDLIKTSRSIYHAITVMTFIQIALMPFSSLIISNENLTIVALTDFMVAIMKLILAVYIGYLSENILLIFGLCMAIIPLNKHVILFFYAKKNYKYIKINFFNFYEKKNFYEIFKFTKHMFYGSFAGAINAKGRDILVNVYFGPAVNAAQALTSQVSGQLQSLSNVFSSVLDPVIIKKSSSKGNEEMIKMSMLGTLFSVCLLLLLVLPFLIEIEYIFSLWLTKIPKYTILFTKIFLVRLIVNQIYIQLQTCIFAIGDVKRFQIIFSIIKIIPIIITLMLFQLEFEPHYLYINLVLAEFFVLVLVLQTLKNQIRYDVLSFKKKIAFPLIVIITITVISCLFVKSLLSPSLFRIALVFISSSVCISTFFIIFGLDSKSKKILYVALIKKFKI